MISKESITRIENEDWVHLYFQDTQWNTLWYIRYNIETQEDKYVIIYINDIISWYKFEKNCSENMKSFFSEKIISNPWTGFWRMMWEYILRYFKDLYPWKTIYINFKSLDKKENIIAIQNLVWEIGRKCADICTFVWGWNIENYTGTITLWA